MSVSLQQPISPLPIMHMSSTEEAEWKGTLPEGKTVEKVLAVMSEIFKNAILSSNDRLKQKDLSVDDLFKLSGQKRDKKSTEGLVTALLGAGSGIATLLSGFGFVAAPWLQQFNHGITPDTVSKTAEAGAQFFRTGSDTFKAYQEGAIGEIDTRYSIEQSVSLQASQQSYMALHQFITRIQELETQILSSQTRASGG